MIHETAFNILAGEIDRSCPDESPEMALARIRGTLAGLRATSDRNRHGYFTDEDEATEFCRGQGWESFHLWASPRGWQVEEVKQL